MESDFSMGPQQSKGLLLLHCYPRSAKSCHFLPRIEFAYAFSTWSCFAAASSENSNVNSKRIFFNADLVRPHFALKLQFAAVFSLQHCTADSSTTGGNEKKMLEHEHVIGQLAIPLPTSLVAERDLLFAFLNTKCF